MTLSPGSIGRLSPGHMIAGVPPPPVSLRFSALWLSDVAVEQDLDLRDRTGDHHQPQRRELAGLGTDQQANPTRARRKKGHPWPLTHFTRRDHAASRLTINAILAL